MKPLVLKIKTLAATERKITAEIIDCIREVELLKIHLELGYPSLMEFLVRECGYSETAALRRIDAARVVNVIPEIRADLKSGSLNLSQVSIVAQSVRQKEKMGEKVSLETKKDLLKAVQNKRSYEVQKIAAQMLELPMLQTEKARVQADESVRVEMSFTKAEMASVQKAKELLGHIRPGLSIKELVVLMAERVIKAKDPAREVRLRRSKGDLCGGPMPDSINLAQIHQAPTGQESTNQESASSRILKGVSASVRRYVFRRDKVCQWANPTSGIKCESRHLLEIDHKYSKWAGGGHRLENLELKCRAHNQWKYKKEAGLSSVPVVNSI